MSKFKFILQRGELCLAEYSEAGAGAEFIFPKETRGSLTVAATSYPLALGRTSITMRGAKDGVYTPRLVGENGETPLPEIKKEGNLITFVGYSDSELCRGFDEIRKLKKSYRELSERYKALETYVYGKGIF